MEKVSVSASPLLSLPEHLLALVVSEGQGGKNGLRTTCRSLRLAVNDCTSALAWTRPRRLDGGPVLHAQLPAALTRASSFWTSVARLEFSIASCPPTHQTLLCCFTQLQLLVPREMQEAADPQLQQHRGVRAGPPVCVHDAADPQL